jgi:hypothetical protein
MYEAAIDTTIAVMANYFRWNPRLCLYVARALAKGGDMA